MHICDKGHGFFCCCCERRVEDVVRRSNSQTFALQGGTKPPSVGTKPPSVMTAMKVNRKTGTPGGGEGSEPYLLFRCSSEGPRTRERMHGPVHRLLPLFECALGVVKWPMGQPTVSFQRSMRVHGPCKGPWAGSQAVERVHEGTWVHGRGPMGRPIGCWKGP